MHFEIVDHSTFAEMLYVCPFFFKLIILFFLNFIVDCDPVNWRELNFLNRESTFLARNENLIKLNQGYRFL